MLEGQRIRTAPLASLYRSQQVAELLKQWIEAGEFLLTEPVASLPSDRQFQPQDQRSPSALNDE